MTEVVEGIVIYEGDLELVNKSKADRVNELQDMIIHSAQNMVQYAIEIGSILIDVKASLSHGEWYPWVRVNLNIHPTTVQDYMRLAKANAVNSLHFNDVSSINEALKLIAPPKQLKLPEDTSTRILRKENEFGFPEYEVEVIEGEGEEHSSWELEVINRSPLPFVEEEYESVTFLNKSKEEEEHLVSKIKISDSVKELATAFITIENCIINYTGLELPEDNDLSRHKEVAYYIQAIQNGLNHLSECVNNWTERNPEFMEGKFKPYNPRVDDPIQREKNEKFQVFDAGM